MVSYAAGSVGPHIGQYDVFLLQASGHRRWLGGKQPGNAPSFRALTCAFCSLSS